MMMNTKWSDLKKSNQSSASRLIAGVALGVCLAALGNASVHAAIYTWDAVPGDSGITDGSGTWRLSGTNWWDGTQDRPWASGNEAVFGGGSAGAAGTISLGSNISVQKITLNAANGGGGYTIDVANRNLVVTLSKPLIVGINSSIIDSVGTGTLTFNNSDAGGTWNTHTLTISAKVAGATANFSHNGSGSVVLGNDGNTFGGYLYKQNSGSITVTSIRNSGSASAAGAGNEVQIGINGGFTYAGSGDSTNRLFTLFGTGNATLTSNGTGPLVLTGTVSNTSTAAKILFLNGTNSGGNEVQGILADNGVNTLAVTKDGAGTWLVSGANTYTGTTTIRQGALQIGNGGPSGSLSPSSVITGLAAGTLVFNQSDTVTQGVDFAAAIAGSLSLTQAGPGALVLNGANTFSGTTRVVNGTLTVGNALALQNSTLDLAATDVGTITAIGDNATLGGLTGTRDLDMLTRTLSIGNNNRSLTYGGVLSNGALTKVGTGSLVLSGTSTYAGPTTVGLGSLLVNGGLPNTASVTVQSGGLLGGSGSIAGPVSILDGGTLAPGNSPGTLVLGNVLTLEPGSVLNFEFNAQDTTVGGGVNDLVTGVTNLVLDGVLNISGTGDWSAVTANTMWRLFDYSGDLTDNTLALGTTPILGNDLAFLLDTATPGQVNLMVVPEPSALVLVAGLAVIEVARRRRRAGARIS